MSAIIIRTEKNYGKEVIYPVCEKAKAFAKIAGTKTLTKQTLSSIKMLGYEIEVKNPPFNFI